MLLLGSNHFLIYGRYCETGPTVYSPYPRRLESLTIWCNYKGSTFSSVILRPWVLVRLESNSRPPVWQPDAQPTEQLVRGCAINAKEINLPRRRLHDDNISAGICTFLWQLCWWLPLDCSWLRFSIHLRLSYAVVQFPVSLSPFWK